jgi:hypothetical protein
MEFDNQWQTYLHRQCISIKLFDKYAIFFNKKKCGDMLPGSLLVIDSVSTKPVFAM